MPYAIEIVPTLLWSHENRTYTTWINAQRAYLLSCRLWPDRTVRVVFVGKEG